MDEKELIRARLLELDRLAYERNILKSSGFLSVAEQNEYHMLEQSGAFQNRIRFLAGGFPEAERARALFLPEYMDKETAEAAEIALLRVTPLNGRFAEALSHRDYLGSLMNLGIERDRIGDILTEETEGIVFCAQDMADYIAENLVRIRHTSVQCEKTALTACSYRPKFEELQVNVASERIDAVLAALYRLPRQKAQARHWPTSSPEHPSPQRPPWARTGSRRNRSARGSPDSAQTGRC